jgi:hypothetical protein
MSDSPKLPLARTVLRLLFFRSSREELLALDQRHLVLGLVSTWLVGMGRYWDDPGAHLLQHLGVGSVVYVFALSGFLWLLLWPLGPADWTYRRLLTFVSLVSPPAALYAIPVERFLTLDMARSVNVWFLAVVATWRVALLAFYLRRSARLPWLSMSVATLLPLGVIVTVLTMLNLERAVFDVMGGLNRQGTANDSAYLVLILLTMASWAAVGPLAIIYGVISVLTYKRKHSQVQAITPDPGQS